MYGVCTIARRRQAYIHQFSVHSGFPSQAKLLEHTAEHKMPLTKFLSWRASGKHAKLKRTKSRDPSQLWVNVLCQIVSEASRLDLTSRHESPRYVLDQRAAHAIGPRHTRRQHQKKGSTLSARRHGSFAPERHVPASRSQDKLRITLQTNIRHATGASYLASRRQVSETFRGCRARS